MFHEVTVVLPRSLEHIPMPVCRHRVETRRRTSTESDARERVSGSTAQQLPSHAGQPGPSR